MDAAGFALQTVPNMDKKNQNRFLIIYFMDMS